MKHYIVAALLITLLACQTTTTPPLPAVTADDELAPLSKEDENFTGVKKYRNAGKLIKEVTFVNGVKNGICKNYYDDGRLKSTIIYRNELKEDTAKWYYPEGMVYRTTPYINNTINGRQEKFYKSGRIQASIPYKNSLRMPGLREYNESGSMVKGYPEITYTFHDYMNEADPKFVVEIKLSNGSVNVKHYRGSLIDGAFDPEKCRDITASSGIGYIELRKDPVKGKNYVDVISVFMTRFRNSEILTKRIKLPYPDLN